MSPTLFVAEGRQPLLRQIGLDAETVFEHPDIRVWRKLPDRENATLDADLPDGPIRLHVKRYAPAKADPAAAEANGIRLLAAAGIPTVPLVAWGGLPDGRTFILMEDLAGFAPADKLIAAGMPFDRLLEPTARLGAQLHAAGLHHRDLYLCHFFAREREGAVELRLIDAARVRRLPWLLAGRWIVKDLAQFWFSARQLSIPDDRLSHWLDIYSAARSLSAVDRLRRRIERKAAWIARHDQRLRQRQPKRNISIPGS